MRQKQAEKIVDEYLKKIYGFVLTKAANLQDAEDLSQEIALKLYRAALITEIEQPSAFVWRIVHNVLANYYRGKSRNGVGMIIEEIAENLISEENLCDSMVQDESIRHLHGEIAYLSQMQRKIVIMYYYECKKQEEIAKILHISKGTVKWHLFEAKSEMKKGLERVREARELKFNPIKFDLMGVSGSVGTMGNTGNFFRNSLTQNIAYCILRESRTINEIADCLGVSPVYVEGEVEFLEEYGFLIKQGKKYLANILIEEPSEEINRLQDIMYQEAAKLLANELYEELLQSGLLESQGIYYPNGDINFAMWTLIFYIIAMGSERLSEESIKFEEVATLRPDGGHNIAYASVMNPSIVQARYFENMKQWCGPCWNESQNIMIWQIDSEWSSRRVDDRYMEVIKHDLQLFKRFLGNEILSPYEYAYMVEKGYIKTEGKPEHLFKASLEMVWIRDQETKQQLIELGQKVKERYKEHFEMLKVPFEKAVLEKTPKQLRKMKAYGLQFIFQADGWFLLYCAKELVGNGKLKLPTDEQKKVLTTLIVSR